MVRLREVPRTAAFAWSPGTGLPLIATGTKAGAVDADFSTDTVLELWDLQLGQQHQVLELQPSGSIGTDSRFHDIAWAKVKSEHGIIAGALENGSLDLWDADKLLNGGEDAFMSRTSKHSGAIKALQFNPFRSELLATAGAKGELFISDLNNVANPFRLGTTAARADDFDGLDWNKKVPHILVTGSSGGFVTVWDVKAKKESLTLNNLGRKAVSAVAWDPAQSTKLATAIPDDTNPQILIWDLRNSNAPERTLRAHEQGVLSLSWCPQDPDLLLSCGKDNRTICWNSQSGEAFGEFPIVTNWTFQTRWNPHFPSIFATASFDGRITVQTIQNTKPATGQAAGAQAQVLDGEDFFNSAQTEPPTAAFSLPKAPRWHERPTGAAFGFGGKIVSFSPADASSGAPPRKSKVRISHFAVEGGIGNATEAFEKSLAEGDINGICQSHIANARTEEEKADWRLLQTLIADNPRRKLVEVLGFSDDAEGSADASPKATADDDGPQTLAPSDAEETQPDGSKPASARKDRLSSFFEGTGDGDSFLSDLSATKGAKTNNPFQIYTGSESVPDKQITQALILGQFEKAMEICLREDRMSDAFVVAICGGQRCIEKAQAAYFAKKTQGPNYTRLLASVIGKNLWDVVYNADLSNWKEVMATVCTYANEDEFPDLCEGLGDRLEDELKAGGDKTELRKSASFCYLAGSKLDKVVTIWIEETQEDETAGLQQGEADSTFSLHAKSLQNLMEKVAVFRKVTHFEDKERDRPSDWKLAALYDKYTEYADVLAAHGFLEVAERYLDLLPPQYAAAEVARNRVKQATRKQAPQPQAKQAALPGRPAPKTQMNQPSAAGRYGAPNPYAPNTPALPAAQPGAANPNVYAPSGFQQPQPPFYNAAGATPLVGAYARPGPGAPPRNVNASPALPPPPRASEQNWNDTPMVTKAMPARRSTPAGGVPSASTPFINQPQQYPYQVPPPGAPFTPQQRATPPLPPPPKGSGPPPRMTSPPTVGVPGHPQMPPPERPASATRNPYAPAPYGQPAAAIPPPPTVPRGPSPYNPPPAGAPPTSRYAPAAPAPGVAPPDLQGRPQPPPPPQQSAGAPRPGPPMQGYAPQPMLGAQASGRATPYGAAPPTQQGPPQAAGPPPPNTNLGAQPQARAQTPNAGPTRYPAGDRSHLPEPAVPVYEILSAIMQNVKAKAPPQYTAQVLDAEKRLNILFDHLNNGTLLQPDTVMSMQELAFALRDKDYDAALTLQVDLHTNKVEQCGQWMVGVKRLILMSKATQ